MPSGRASPVQLRDRGAVNRCEAAAQATRSAVIVFLQSDLGLKGVVPGAATARFLDRQQALMRFIGAVALAGASILSCLVNGSAYKGCVSGQGSTASRHASDLADAAGLYARCQLKHVGVHSFWIVCCRHVSRVLLEGRQFWVIARTSSQSDWHHAMHVVSIIHS